MKRRTSLLLFLALISGIASAQTKDQTDKFSKESRPGFFHELQKTEFICMENCPIEIENLMGIQVLCGNYKQESFQQHCQNVGDSTPVEYCNCDKQICAKFKVSCSSDGITCQVKLAETGIKPSACQCNGNSCEAPDGNYSQSTCFMRRELDQQSCDIHRLVDFRDGRSYHTTCDEASAQCQTEGVMISNSDATGAAKKEQPAKMTEPK